MNNASNVRVQSWMSAWAVLLVLQVPGCWCEPVEPEKFNTFPAGLAGGADDYCAAWAQSACQRAQRCDPAVYAGFNSLGGCAVRMEERCRRDHAPQLAAESVQRVQYDNRHAQGCVTQEATRGCNEPESTSCARVFTGAVPANQPCVDDGECASGLWCSGGPLSCGVCTARAPLGGPCWTPSSCQAGLTCLGGLCNQPLGLGAGCATAPDACGNGTFCFPVIPGVGPLPFSTCASPAGEGASCGGQLPLPCNIGLTCVTTADRGAICLAPLAEGAACDPQGTATPPCADLGKRLFCDSGSRTCRAVTVAALDDGCGLSAVCQAQLRCQSNRCVARPRPGEACSVDPGGDPCFESTCQAGTCVANAAAGDGCDAGCPGLSCVGNTCGKGVCDGGEAFDAWVPPPDASMPNVTP
jgi:hypothetical protein